MSTVKREIISHRIPGQDHSQKIDIVVLGKPGQGNACHEYEIRDSKINEPDIVLADINFQN